MSCCPYKITREWGEVPLEGLLRHVAPIVPDIPHAMSLDRIRQRYIEFARKSSLICARLDITYQAGVRDYYFSPPDGFEVFQVLGFDSPGHAFVDYWRGHAYNGHRTDFVVLDNKGIALNYTPTTDGTSSVGVIVSLVPSECATTILRSIATPYGAGIAKGAVADLLRLPNKPWTHLGLANQYELEFNRVVQSARNLAETNRQTGPIKPFRRRVV